MLLWELAFEKIPYENWNMEKIKEWVLSGKRERLVFGRDKSEIEELQQEYKKIIVAAWHDDPQIRATNQFLFMQLNKLSQKYYDPRSNSPAALKPDKTIDLDGTLFKSDPVSVSDQGGEDLLEFDDDFSLDSIPEIPTLDDGISAHKKKETTKAWDIFCEHTNLGSTKAKYWKGYYLWEGYAGQKDRKQASTLFKEAADDGLADAQLRYAFSLVGNQGSKFDRKIFIEYLTKAAENHSSTAQFNLGDLYLNGKLGVPQNIELGKKYLRLAALTNQPKAIEILQKLGINIYNDYKIFVPPPTLPEISKETPRNIWKSLDYEKYEDYVTISSISSTVEQEIDERVIYKEDLEKRKQAFGICGECNEPGTGEFWCQPCNAKRFKDNFKNWTSGYENIDEFIQQSQLYAVHHTKCLEWILFEKFQNVTYITKGGFSKVYSAEWTEGYIKSWNIENQKWNRSSNIVVALKCLDNTSDMSINFLKEVKYHLQIYVHDVIQCYGITQDPKTKNFIMVLFYCENGNLRTYLNQNSLTCEEKLFILFQIIRGLLDIHNAEKIHEDLHSGNILLDKNGYSFICDFGLCQPVNNNEKPGELYGVLPYTAPEVILKHHYTKASNIYSFGVIMNEVMTEKFPYNDCEINLDLTLEICNGLRPDISEDTPKLLADLITKCWNSKAENRPTTKELYEIFFKWNNEKYFSETEIYSQIEECEIRKSKKKSKIHFN